MNRTFTSVLVDNFWKVKNKTLELKSVGTDDP